MSNDDAIRDMVYKRFKASALVTDYFPLRLLNGSVVRGFKAKCGTCADVIVRGKVRGEVRSAPAGTYRVTATGHCASCDTLESFLFHIVPEGEDDFRIVNMKTRGWPEEYACEVVEFPVPKREFEYVADTPHFDDPNAVDNTSPSG